MKGAERQENAKDYFSHNRLMIGKYLGSNYSQAVAVSNGSAVLYMVIRALDMDKIYINKYVMRKGNYDNVSTPASVFTMAGLF